MKEWRILRGEDLAAPRHSPAVDLLREHLDSISEEIVGRVRKEVPAFADLPESFLPMLREVGRKACITLFRGMDGSLPPDWSMEVGELRGFELVDVLRAFQVGSEVVWSWAKRLWEAEGFPDRELVGVAETIWNAYFRAANSVADEYLRHRQALVREFNRFLNRLRAGQDVDYLVEQIVEGACEVLGFRRAVFFRYEHEMLVPVAARDRRDPSWGEGMLREKKAYPINPLSDSPEAQAFFAGTVREGREGDQARTAFLDPLPGSRYFLVPVNPHGSSKGLLYVEAEAGFPITDRDLEMLNSFADTVGLSLENARLYQELLARRKMMDHLLSRVNTAHEEERARIARELHDSVAQSLLKIIYTAGFALDFLKEDPRLAVEEIEEVQQRAKDCLRELRAIMSNLRPTSLDILGLRETIQRYAEQFEEEYAITTTVDLQGLESLSPSVELAVFRILQEELTNVRKHSNADSVRIKTERRGDDLYLVVEDDGIGFDPQALAAEQESGKHLGLVAIRERAELLGGEMTIDSEPGRGTRIVVRIPMMVAGE
ncbi:MAG: GAF domain-containing sensor histidine kinase [Actinomycetota bacterium]|nr:GAF domain-containing sensor histidine kinase [Actinomycetota bacterium]MDI7252393.1 GAF domain-containing sensor histidine kinase [Actinomycetota bacterium]